MQIILFLLLLTLIYLVSGQITSGIYSLALKIFKGPRWGIYVLSFFLLPGTVIHELSHFFMATALRVPTGKISVIPKVEGRDVKTGSMEMAHTDPFRHTLIGFAPLLSGIATIYFTGKYFLPEIISVFQNPFPQTISGLQVMFSVSGIYILSIISLTMFTSKKDLEGFKIAAPILILAFLALNYAGIDIVISPDLVERINKVISDLNILLGIAAGIDLLVLMIIKIFNKI